MEKIEKKQRVMPYNVEAERSVLGAMLIDQQVASDASGKLQTEDFYLQAHQNIFDAILSLCAENKPVDAISCEDMLAQSNKLESSGGLEYILDLSNYVPASASYTYYLDILKRTSLSRSIIRRASEIVDKAYNEPDSQEVLAFAEKQIFDISKERDNSTLEHIKKSADIVINNINEACRGEYKGGSMTGFSHFDNLTSGLKPGELILLAARPAVGKTAFALNIATNMGLNGGNVAIFSLEMPDHQLTSRILSAVSKTNIRDGLKNGFSINATGKLMAGYNELIKSKIFIDDSSVTKPMDIRSKCMRLIREHGKLSLIVVDYLQLMTSDRKVESRQNEVAELSRSMKIIAKELDTPILLLSQLSRAIENRTGHKPMLSDLRESGAIEQDADIVMFLDKPYLYDKTQPKDLVILNVAKHRNGELADLELRWTGEIMKFDDMIPEKPVREEIEPPTTKSTEDMIEVEGESPFTDDVPFDVEDEGVTVSETFESASETPYSETDEVILDDVFFGSEADDDGELGF